MTENTTLKRGYFYEVVTNGREKLILECRSNKSYYGKIDFTEWQYDYNTSRLSIKRNINIKLTDILSITHIPHEEKLWKYRYCTELINELEYQLMQDQNRLDSLKKERDKYK